MTINYRNTKEDNIEINKFLFKNKLYKFNKIMYIYHLRYFILLLSCIFLLDTFFISKNFTNIFKDLRFYLFFSLAGYLIIDSSLGTALSNSLDKVIKQKSYILKNKSVTIKNNHIELHNSVNKQVFNIQDICKIVENEYNLYIFFTGYKDFLTIPYSAFKNEDEKNVFIAKLG